MNNYKIKVNNEAESREAQELFFELGYGWNGGKVNEYTNVEPNPYISAFGDGMVLGMGYGRFNHKEITLPQLRDLVVLKRNNIEDATHECVGDKFLVQEHRRYEWTFSGWATSGIAMSKLKPISEQQMASHNIEQQELQANPKLFLDPTQGYMEIEWDGSFMKQDHWVEVPDGAEVAFLSRNPNLLGRVCFAKHEGNQVLVKNPSDIDFDRAGWVNWKHFLDNGHNIVWQRTQDEPFLTPESVLPQGIDATLAERQSTYGNFEDVAFVTENIMGVLAKVRVNGLSELPNPHRMALYMIASKMARIVNGDFNHFDSWHDIAGYAKLIENLIKD